MPDSSSSTSAAELADHPFAERPIPVLDPSLKTFARTEIPVDLDDPRAREPLVEVRDLGLLGDNFYARADGSNPPYKVRLAGAIADLWLRKSVAETLAEADAALRAWGLRAYVHDGYRPIATQQGLWDFFHAHFAAENPGWSAAELEAQTRRFVSDPRAFDPADPRTWPLHSTGGAVDLTLVTVDGGALDFGTAFDDPTERAATGWLETLNQAGEVADDDPRLMARRILYWTMAEAGFTNYLHEWWHYDLGDQMYVFTLAALGRPLASGKAWYGYTEPPSGR